MAGIVPRSGPPSPRTVPWYTLNPQVQETENVSLTVEPMVGENVSRLIPYRPGKPIDEVKRELGLDEVIKLASNENSLGPSPRAIEAMREAAERVHLYPDAVCYELRQKVADHLDIPEECLVFGNGSDDIIHLLG